MTTAIQIALVDLLASWNIRPTRVIGHSSGEIAAAYCAGALTQESALAVAYHRGRVALKLKDLKDGAMLVVGLCEEEVKSDISTLDQSCVNVACVNSPSNITVSGDRAAISELSANLKARNVFFRELAVEVAYHSCHMEYVAEEYLAALQNIQPKSGNKVVFHSSVSGKPVNASDLGPGYWVSNMVNAVQFSSSLGSLLFDKESDTALDILVEIGPHSALQGPIKQIVQHHTKQSASHVQYNSALVRNVHAVHTCHALVAQLLVNGFPVDLSAVNCPLSSQSNKVLVDLPPYTWDHSTSYWAEPANSRKEGERAYSRSDILGVKVRDSTSTEPRWRNIVRPSEIPWVNDHVVQSNTLYPAAGFLAMAIEAEYQHSKMRCGNIKGYSLREVTIDHALLLSQDAAGVETVISLRPHNESARALSDLWNEFSISSSVDGSSWTENCRGLISVQEHVQGTEVDGGRRAHEESEQFRQLKSDFEKECTTTIDDQEMYKSLGKLGLSFGPTFANLQKVRASSNRCVAEVSVPNTAAVMPAQFEYPFIIHPATLDSCIHAVFPIGDRYHQQDQGTPVPTFIEELFISQSIEKTPGHVFKVYAQSDISDVGSRANIGHGRKTNCLSVFDREQVDLEPMITFNGLVFTTLPNNTREVIDTEERRIYYQTDWQPDPGFLSSVQATEISAAFRKPFPLEDQACISQQAAFYYAELALETLSNEDVAAMQPHHRKLHASLNRSCSAVHDGQLGMFPTYDWLRLNSEERTAICARVGQIPYGILLCPIGENLSRILRQEIDPLSVMVEEDRLERYYRTYEPIERSYQQAAVYIKLLGNKNPHLNILEIGAGTGGATLPILEALSGIGVSPPNFTNYDFTDLSPAFFEKAREKTGRWGELVTFKKLDIECAPILQGYEPESYDLIIAANVVHATSCIESTMKRIRGLLKPGGTLILIEITVQTIAASLVFGTLPGWWNGTSHCPFPCFKSRLIKSSKRRNPCRWASIVRKSVG